MTEQSPAPSAPAPESFPEFDAPAFVPPAPSPALNVGVPAPKAAAPAEPEKVAEPKAEAPAAGDAPATETPAGPKPDEVPAADEAAEPEPGPFQFAGRTFKDAAAAEHYLKTMEGRAKSEAKRVAETEQRLAEAARAASYYKAEAEKKAQPQEKPTEPAKAEKSWLENPELWSTVRKLAADEGTDAAMFYALQQAEGNMNKVYEAKLEAALAPFKKAEQQTHLREYTGALFQAAEDFSDAAGNPVYPELRDPKANEAVVRIWTTLDPAFALTERGVDYAVLRYRAEKGGAPAPTKAPAPSGAAATTAQTLAAATTAPETVSGNGTPRPAAVGDAAARSKRVLGDGGRPRLTPSGESLGFID